MTRWQNEVRLRTYFLVALLLLVWLASTGPVGAVAAGILLLSFITFAVVTWRARR